MYNADFRKNDHVESLKVLFLESGQGRRKPTEKEKEEIIFLPEVIEKGENNWRIKIYGPLTD